MKTPEQIADELQQTQPLNLTEREMMVRAIEADRAQCEVIPAMYESSELQGAIDQFNEVYGSDYLTVLAVGERLRDIVNDYLDQVLIHVDRV